MNISPRLSYAPVGLLTNSKTIRFPRQDPPSCGQPRPDKSTLHSAKSCERRQEVVDERMPSWCSGQCCLARPSTVLEVDRKIKIPGSLSAARKRQVMASLQDSVAQRQARQRPSLQNGGFRSFVAAKPTRTRRSASLHGDPPSGEGHAPSWPHLTRKPPLESQSRHPRKASRRPPR